MREFWSLIGPRNGARRALGETCDRCPIVRARPFRHSCREPRGQGSDRSRRGAAGRARTAGRVPTAYRRSRRARQVWCDAENVDWRTGTAISFQIKALNPEKLSVSFFDRNRVVYTTWIELQGGVWQPVRILFNELHPNPYFQPPDAKTGAPSRPQRNQGHRLRTTQSGGRSADSRQVRPLKIGRIGKSPRRRQTECVVADGPFGRSTPSGARS